MDEKQIQQRINRISGQVNGINKMIQEGRPCEDILQQIQAVRAALAKLGIKLLKDETSCLVDFEDKSKMDSFEKLINNFLRIQ